MNLLDDSLSSDLDRLPNGLDEKMHSRFIALADYGVATGADAILFTCSAFGPCIDAVKRRYPERPVLKPNEAMIVEAVAMGSRIGLVASFEPTLRSMPAEFPTGVCVDCELAAGALAALDAGDTATHDRLVTEAAMKLHRRGCGAIALAQFSLARAAAEVRKQVPVPVLTTVDSAVVALRARLGHQT